MGWQDIKQDMIAAGEEPDYLLLRFVEAPSETHRGGRVQVNLDDLAKWIDEHFIAKKIAFAPGDMLLTLPPDPVGQDHARLEALLSENAETIAAFAKDAEAAVRIVAMMIGMGGVR